MKEYNVVIACGGTGGHLFPGIAIGQELERRGHNVLLLISEKKIDALAIQGHDALRHEKVPSIAFPPLLSPKVIPFAGRFLKSLLRCRSLFRSFKADAVVGMGGFTSTAPILAGKLCGCRNFIHESNAIPGKANRLNARFCQTVLLGLEDCGKFFSEEQVRVVGTPLRDSMLEPEDMDHAMREMGLEQGRKTLLVMGGSQGAHGLNEAVCKALSFLDPNLVQILHISGPSDHDFVREKYEKRSFKATILPFCQDMHLAYAVADLAVCRSGASSLTELSSFGIPSILVPYPYAAEDHQTRNAEVFRKAKAAFLIPEEELDAKTFGETVMDLLSNDHKLAALSKNMKALAVPDSANQIANTIESACQNKTSN